VSQENVELVRSVLAALVEGLDVGLISAARESGDYGSVEWAHPEMDWVIADGPSAGSWIGIAGMVESVGGMLDAWEEWHLEADRYWELDHERVLVLTRIGGRGKTSGVEVWTTSAHLFHVRDESVTKIVTYYDRHRALADLGLEE
jgi:ketosteroid isomerase-like protein